jgi:hypothetical protein
MMQSGEGIVEIGLDSAEQDFMRLCNSGNKSAESVAAEWVPPGLAALWLGIDAARARIGAAKIS